MTVDRKKTAKELAFDRERQRLRHQIKVLQEEKRKLEIELGAKQVIEENLNRIIDTLTDENEKLGYMIGIPKEDLERFFRETHEKAERDKEAAQALEALLALHNGLY
jgi:adenylate kinase